VLYIFTHYVVKYNTDGINENFHQQAKNNDDNRDIILHTHIMETLIADSYRGFANKILR
jgi:hypothetical protein